MNVKLASLKNLYLSIQKRKLNAQDKAQARRKGNIVKLCDKNVDATVFCQI